jgi:hypothetical protein
MIQVKTAHAQEKEMFQSYDDLFEHIVALENHKMLQIEPDFKTMEWSFAAHPPRHVDALYAHLKDQHPAISQACESQLPLIEICTGDYANPEYVVATENLNVSHLKKQWTLAYCDAHNMTVATNH